MVINYGQAAALFSYEPETGQLRWRVSRGNKAKVGSVAGCINRKGYILVRALGRLYPAHRLAWLLTHGCWPSDQIDHINGVRDDNRLVNLRECTHVENHQNRGAQRNNTSGFVGVTWYPQTAKWKAQITVRGKHRNLGYFPTPEEAYAAYLASKADLHEFQPIPREKIQ